MAKAKTTPQVKKITEAEMLQLQQLEADKNRLVTELGNISLQRISLDELEDKAIETKSRLDQYQQSVLQALSEKYPGKTIDIATGVLS